MTQFSHINSDYPPTQGRVLRTPIDGLINRIAQRLGGSNSRELERFIKFAIVGFIGAVVDLGTSNLLMATLLPADKLANVIIAATISFIAAVLSNFTWNRYWTYPDSRSRALQSQLLQFGLVSISGWLGRTIWITASHDMLSTLVHDTIGQSFDSAKVDQISATIAIMIGIFVVMIWNFFINRHWTYNDVS
jgi:putative flippase GtrA